SCSTRDTHSFPTRRSSDLCEVETDKAVYPIQSSFAGVMGEWKTKVGDTVEIGQELGTLFTDEASLADQLETASKESTDRKPVERSEEHTSELQSPDHLVCR